MTQSSPAGLIRQRLVALAMIGGPLLLAAGSLLVPADVDSKADSLQATAAQLQVAAVHRGQVFAALLLHVLGGLLLIPAVGGLLRLARHRGAALATTGGVLAGIGASFIAADAALFGLTSYFASAPGLDQAAMARYLFTMKADPGAYLLFFVYLLFPVGILVTAIALLRARTVARWQPWLLLVGIVLAVAAPGGIVGGLAQLPLIAAFTALASHLWRPATTPTPTWSTATPHRQAPPTDRAPQTSSFSSVGVAAEGGHLRAWDLPPSACHQRSASCTDPGPWLSPSP